MEKPVTILVVDDSAMLRHIVSKELANEGFHIIEAQDGVSALSMAMNCLPDLITMDIDMPHLDGFDTCRKLREEPYISRFSYLPDNLVPVVFITANDNMADRQKGFELGAADFIAKPFKRGEILQVVNKILKRNKPLEGLTALVVDDAETALHVTSDILEREGLTVFRRMNGVTAFELLKEKMEKIDILLTDVEMPHMKGDELCEKVRTELGLTDLPIIFLTGIPDRSNLLSVFKAGATDYLVKPFVKEELIARVKSHLERAQLTRSLRKTIQELQTANQEIKALSITDPLTGCYNRAYLNEQYPREINRSIRSALPLSIVLCDLDHFKNVNDTYGHPVGDTVLKAFAGCIKAELREDVDWTCRYGGEEFLVVLPETNLKRAGSISEKIRVAVSRMVTEAAGYSISITSSFGTTCFNPLSSSGQISPEKLLSHADQLLYLAKREGRNRVKTGLP